MYDPAITISMQSDNGGVTPMKGMAHNVRSHLGILRSFCRFTLWKQPFTTFSLAGHLMHWQDRNTEFLGRHAIDHHLRPQF